MQDSMTIEWTPEALAKLPPAITLDTAASILGISKSHAYVLNAKGEFPARILKLGGVYKVVTRDLLRTLDAA